MFVMGLLLAWNNSLTVSADLVRNQVAFEKWQPYSWEFTSFLAIFIMYFGVAWLAVKRPLLHPRWLKNLSIHMLATVIFSVGHVVLMVSMRKAIYLWQGVQYDFGHWPTEIIYEYRKDIISYIVFLSLITLYQYVSRLRKNELASLDKKIKIKNKQGVHWLDPEDISTIESGGNYIYFNAKDGVFPMRSTMTEVAQKLDESHFIRVHRSYIVNIIQIKSLSDQAKDPCLLILKNDKQVPVSRKYRDQVLQLVHKVI
jgi:DNA-binding LytR/AlgR family response regulator